MEEWKTRYWRAVTRWNYVRLMRSRNGFVYKPNKFCTRTGGISVLWHISVFHFECIDYHGVLNLLHLCIWQAPVWAGCTPWPYPQVSRKSKDLISFSSINSQKHPHSAYCCIPVQERNIAILVDCWAWGLLTYTWRMPNACILCGSNWWGLFPV